MDLKFLNDIQKIELYENINLEKYTTIKLANHGSIALCETLDSLKILIQRLKKNKVNYHLVGWGANQVLLNTASTLFIKLKFKLEKDLLLEVRDEYYLPASTPLNLLTSTAVRHGLMGWEVFTGIPASLGGAIYMNAGTSLGEISELVVSVDILKVSGDIYRYYPKKGSFSYRRNHFVEKGEVVVAATIKHLGISSEIKTKIQSYLEMRKRSQPLKTRNCGSVFKNLSPEIRAGEVIDKIGLKSFGTNDVAVSEHHANFIENRGVATAEEFSDLLDFLKLEMERYSGHKFELEVKVY